MRVARRLLVAKAFFCLVRVDFILRIRGYRQLRALLEGASARSGDVSTASSVAVTEAACNAALRACSWYFPRPLCLQRSAATALLLRRHGVPATVVVGARIAPVQGHAWVEVGELIVNDDPEFITRHYAIVERIP